MGTVTEAKRLLPGLGDGTPASANAYLALVGVVGVVGWGLAVAVNRGVAQQNVSSMGMFGSDFVMLAWAGAVTMAWMALFVFRMLVGIVSVDRGVTFSLPELIWAPLVLGAFGATAYGLTLPVAQFGLKITLVWMPWMAAFAVGYLATGAIVDRGGVYLLAGGVSAALLVAALLGAQVPYPLVVLGVLHAVPMLVDAYRGGRHLTEDGVPALKRRSEDAAGGVVTT
jgi:hypothetical protein